MSAKKPVNLPDMLLKIADVYDDEVDNSVAALTSMLEPIMIVFLALIVGTIVLALFTAADQHHQRAYSSKRDAPAARMTKSE